MIGQVAPPPPRHQVRWAEEEIDRLSELALSIRAKHPELSLVSLVNRAQSQLPAERRRKVTGNNHIQGVINALRKKDEQLRERTARVEQLETQLEKLKHAPTKESILEQLGDEELLARFGQRVLDLMEPAQLIGRLSVEEIAALMPLPDLAGQTARLLTAALIEPRAASAALDSAGLRDLLRQELTRLERTPEARPAPRRRLPRIALLGLKPGQTRAVAEAVSDRAALHFVDKNRKSGQLIPSDTALAIIWVRFTPHAYCDIVAEQLPAERIVRHTGGIQTLLERIEQFLAKDAATVTAA